MSEMIKEFNKGDLLHIDKDGKAQWGYPEGYPYKEGFSIEWDGNTEGLTSVDNMMFKVSDATMTNEEIKNATMVMVTESGADSIKIADFGAHFGLPYDVWDDLVSTGLITDDACFFAVDSLWFAVIRKENITADGHTFVETGTYFLYHDDTLYVPKLDAETTHPISSDFLPLATPTSAGTVKQAATVANVTAAPTAEEFNALLKSLRDAGILATE